MLSSLKEVSNYNQKHRPYTIKNDTLEFNASSFKVRP